MRRVLAAALLIAAAPCAGAAQQGDVAARVQALADEAAIERLILDYGRHLDAKEYDAFAALFAEDGEWHGGGGAPVVGPEAIEAAMVASFGEGSGAVWTSDFHIVGNIAVTLDGDAASAVSRWIFVSPGPDGAPKPVLAGRYVDEFTRTEAGWRFAVRRLVNDMAMQGFPAVRADWENGAP